MEVARRLRAFFSLAYPLSCINDMGVVHLLVSIKVRLSQHCGVDTLLFPWKGPSTTVTFLGRLRTSFGEDLDKSLLAKGDYSHYQPVGWYT